MDQYLQSGSPECGGNGATGWGKAGSAIKQQLTQSLNARRPASAPL